MSAPLPAYLVKHPCSKCGQPTFRICYEGHRLVCVDCFAVICERESKRRRLLARVSAEPAP